MPVSYGLSSASLFWDVNWHLPDNIERRTAMEPEDIKGNEGDIKYAYWGIGIAFVFMMLCVVLLILKRDGYF